MSNILITGINSRIGSAFAFDLIKQKDINVIGTYRTKNDYIEELESLGVKLLLCDFSDVNALDALTEQCDFNDLNSVCLFHGVMEPIGEFKHNDIERWGNSFNINFLSIANALHVLLNKVSSGCRFITLAGGGVNGSPKAYSSYTIAKIALIKLNELLATENPEHFFFNLGPGWVDSPIHQQTISAGDAASEAYQETIRRYQANEFVPIDKVVDALNFFTFIAGKEFSGRNFSAINDQLRSNALSEKLLNCVNSYKLRRFNNEF